MSKIAIILEGDLFNRKGMINAALNRTKYLINETHSQVDVFAISTRYSFPLRIVYGQGRKKQDFVIVDNLRIRMLRHTLSLIDYLLSYKLHYKEIFFRNDLKKYVSLFENYDFILTHSLRSSRLAKMVNEKYGIPFYITWHGSDINVWPFTGLFAKRDTISVMSLAQGNFFVSKALLNRSDDVLKNAKKYVLYNGVDDIFYSYSNEKKIEKQKEFGVLEKKVVAFVGNLESVKNVLVLPLIFERVKICCKNVAFWIIGDGHHRNEIECLNEKYHLNVEMFGNVEYKKMPDLMNCIDVLVLPSKNEGLPLVIVEGIRCGCCVVGSNVGGIGEVLPKENVFDLNCDFVEKISKRIVCLLENKTHSIVLKDDFSWEKTALKEVAIYKDDGFVL